jgi:hypothetical protein
MRFDGLISLTATSGKPKATRQLRTLRVRGLHKSIGCVLQDVLNAILQQLVS